MVLDRWYSPQKQVRRDEYLDSGIMNVRIGGVGPQIFDGISNMPNIRVAVT